MFHRKMKRMANSIDSVLDKMAGINEKNSETTNIDESWNLLSF